LIRDDSLGEQASQCHEVRVTTFREVIACLPEERPADVPQARDWCPRPASLACTMAWARSATCNLVKRLDTWLRTVFWLRPSLAAIAVLARPCATRSSTSRSRSVSCGKTGGGAEVAVK